jgi:hypothetical protein
MKPDLPSLFECLDSKNCTSIDCRTLNALGIIPDTMPFLKQATTPSSITCPGCEKYCPAMRLNRDDNGTYIICDKPQQYGKIFLDNEDLQTWRLDLDGLAGFLSTILSNGNITEIVSGRIYDLGTFSGHALYLVKGIMWQDAQDISNQIYKGSSVFVTLSPPPEWLKSPSLRIAQLLAFNNDVITVSKERLAAILPGRVLSDNGTENIEIYRQDRSKGGKQRHKKTTSIKNNVIRPMFIEKRRKTPNGSVSFITSRIIGDINAIYELNEDNAKVKSFMVEYGIKKFTDIQSTIEYLKNKTDGGQIQNWCYKISKGKL